MKEIILTQGKVALVDDADYDWLNKFTWHIMKTKRNIYAITSKRVGGKIISEYMHRMILNTPQKLQVDHIDHNGLNNQRSNLRNCTRQDNCRNRIAKSKTGYKGVYYSNNKILAQITPCDNKPIHLGYFKTLKEAANKYNEAAIKYFGEFANLNII